MDSEDNKTTGNAAIDFEGGAPSFFNAIKSVLADYSMSELALNLKYWQSFDRCNDLFSKMVPALSAMVDDDCLSVKEPGDAEMAAAVLDELANSKLKKVQLARKDVRGEKQADLWLECLADDGSDIVIKINLEEHIEASTGDTFRLDPRGIISIRTPDHAHMFAPAFESAIKDKIYEIQTEHPFRIKKGETINLSSAHDYEDNLLLKAIVDAVNASPDVNAAMLAAAQDFPRIRVMLQDPQWVSGLTKKGVSEVMAQTLQSKKAGDIPGLWDDLYKGYPEAFKDALNAFASNKIIDKSAFWLNEKGGEGESPAVFLLDKVDEHLVEQFIDRISNNDASDSVLSEVWSWQLKRESAPVNKRSMKL